VQSTDTFTMGGGLKGGGREEITSKKEGKGDWLATPLTLIIPLNHREIGNRGKK